jgi:hypothetical protein
VALIIREPLGLPGTRNVLDLIIIAIVIRMVPVVSVPKAAESLLFTEQYLLRGVAVCLPSRSTLEGVRR